MERTVLIEGREVRLRASAAIPRLYRLQFRRDILQDMQAIQREIAKAEAAREEALAAGKADPGSTLPLEALTLFENVAYVMARHGDPCGVPDSIDEWLDGFGSFSIYTVFPVVQELWTENLRTLNPTKKKSRRRRGKCQRRSSSSGRRS